MGGSKFWNSSFHNHFTCNPKNTSRRSSLLLGRDECALAVAEMTRASSLIYSLKQQNMIKTAVTNYSTDKIRLHTNYAHDLDTKFPLQKWIHHSSVIYSAPSYPSRRPRCWVALSLQSKGVRSHSLVFCSPRIAVWIILNFWMCWVWYASAPVLQGTDCILFALILLAW
jgi:hypothetical protein